MLTAAGFEKALAYWPMFLQGVVCTVALSALTVVFGFILALLLAAALAALIGGGGAAEYTPEMLIAPIAGKNLWGLAAYALFLLTPSLLNLKEDIQWHISRSGI